MLRELSKSGLGAAEFLLSLYSVEVWKHLIKYRHHKGPSRTPTDTTVQNRHKYT